jgi:DNA-binding protein Fis
MQAVILSEGSEIGLRELELESSSPEQTREMDLTVMKRSATAIAPRAADVPADAFQSSEQAWEALRISLRRQVEDSIASPGIDPLPLGTWLIEDLVLAAYRAAGEVSGRARALLGVPETTFRRKLQKATSQERAGLLTRRPPWSDVAPRIAALVRTPDVSQRDVLHAARILLLTEVMAQTDDPSRGAALMGVTVRTFRRWAMEMADGPDLPFAREASAATSLV